MLCDRCYDGHHRSQHGAIALPMDQTQPLNLLSSFGSISAEAVEQECRSGRSTASSILSTGPSSPTRSVSAGHGGGARNAPARTSSGSSTSATAGGGMPRSRASATGRDAGSGNGCATRTCSPGSASRRWCWPPLTATTTRPTTTTPTWRRSASAATCCTTAMSIGAGAGAPCSGARPWATCSRGRTISSDESVAGLKMLRFFPTRIHARPIRMDHQSVGKGCLGQPFYIYHPALHAPDRFQISSGRCCDRVRRRSPAGRSGS